MTDNAVARTDTPNERNVSAKYLHFWGWASLRAYYQALYIVLFLFCLISTRWNRTQRKYTVPLRVQ